MVELWTNGRTMCEMLPKWDKWWKMEETWKWCAKMGKCWGNWGKWEEVREKEQKVQHGTKTHQHEQLRYCAGSCADFIIDDVGPVKKRQRQAKAHQSQHFGGRARP